MLLYVIHAKPSFSKLLIEQMFDLKNFKQAVAAAKGMEKSMKNQNLSKTGVIAEVTEQNEVAYFKPKRHHAINIRYKSYLLQNSPGLCFH